MNRTTMLLAAALVVTAACGNDPAPDPITTAPTVTTIGPSSSAVHVARNAAVTEADVEHPVGSEGHLAAVVVRVRLVDHQDLTSTRGNRDIALHRVLVDVGVTARIGVVDVQLRAVG